MWRAVTIGMVMLGASSAHAGVWPPQAQGLRPVELTQLLGLVISTPGRTLRWDMLQGGQIRWVTPGIESAGRMSARRGFARVRVRGRVSTVLRQQTDELAWSVVLETAGLAGKGPRLNPGRRLLSGCGQIQPATVRRYELVSWRR